MVSGGDSQPERDVITDRSPRYCRPFIAGHIFKHYLAPVLSENHKKQSVFSYPAATELLVGGLGDWVVVVAAATHLVTDKVYVVLICVSLPFFHEQVIDGEVLAVSHRKLAGRSGGTLRENKKKCLLWAAQWCSG